MHNPFPKVKYIKYFSVIFSIIYPYSELFKTSKNYAWYENKKNFPIP